MQLVVFTHTALVHEGEERVVVVLEDLENVWVIRVHRELKALILRLLLLALK